MMGEDKQPQMSSSEDPSVFGQAKIIQLVKAEGGSTIQNVVQQVFVGDYERLRDAYIHPWPVFERVNLSHFVGREWLLAEVDAFLRDQGRGYFILEAEAGLGKTTFLAWLVRERGYIHHFAELAPGLEGVEPGLKNLAAQVVVAYHLSAWEAEGVLPGAAARPDYLSRLLKLAAKQRRDREKIVLVVDALDEAGTPPGQNVLGLPQVLPEGVFLIVSQRPVTVTLDVDTATTRRLIVPLAANDKNNQADMRHFLERAATWPGIARALGESGITLEKFTATLLEKCRGVWIYLHFVVHEIEHGERSPLNLDALPDGLTQYYARYWARWRDGDEDKWYGVYLPLLSTLAAAQEAATAERLAEWVDVKLPLPQVCRLLNERWRPFLALIGQGAHTRYRLYHATLREFFEGKVGRRASKLKATEVSFRDELALATRQAHNRLIERYLSAWGGLHTNLYGLQITSRRTADEGYGLRHLTTHLAAAGRWDLLRNLLRATACVGEQHINVWAEVRRETFGSYTSYLDDVFLAWGQAKTENDVGSQVRYALIYSTIVSLVQESVRQTIPESATPASRFMEATLIIDPRQRIERLAALMPSLNSDYKARAKSIAIEIASDGTKSEDLRTHAIQQFAPFLTSEELARMCKMVRSLQYELLRVPTLCALAAYMPPSNLKQELLQELYRKFECAEMDGVTVTKCFPIWPLHPNVRYHWHSNIVTDTLSWIEKLPVGQQSIFFENILASLQTARTELDRRVDTEEVGHFPGVVDIVAKCSPHMPADLARNWQSVALQLLAPCEDDDSIANGLLTLAPWLAQDLFPTARLVANSIKSNWIKAEVLLRFERYLDAQEIRRLRRILNNPLFLVGELVRLCLSTGSVVLAISCLPRAVLDDLKIWLVAQFHGGLQWDIDVRGGMPGERFGNASPTRTPELAIQESGPRGLALVRDKEERLLTLYSLMSYLKRTRRNDIPRGFWQEVSKREKTGLRLTWTCQQAFVSKYLACSQEPTFFSLLDGESNVSWRNIFRLSVLHLLSGIGGMTFFVHQWWSRQRRDFIIAERLRALNIPGFKPVFVYMEFDTYTTFTRLVALLYSLPSDELKRILPGLLAILSDLSPEYDQKLAETLVALSHTQAVCWEGMLTQMMQVATSIEERLNRALALSALVHHLSELSDDDASELLDSSLRTLAKRGRVDLMIDLRFLAPLLEKLGGANALRETVKAIQDVGRWWP